MSRLNLDLPCPACGGHFEAPADVAVTPAQQAELERRSDALDQDAAKGRVLGVPWDEVVRQLRARR